MTEDVSAIEHPTDKTFGTWFKRIQGQQDWSENVLAARCLSFLNLKGVNLRLADLSEADLSGANFGEISISDDYINETNLKGVKLGGARLDQDSYKRLKELHLLDNVQVERTG
ncbi:pentapeptide repeats family protein [Candidatus Magnetobacterium bavaricum]|uniref:Pentapeptide repeats family protein n=1 Tax=Candidatus Magnetobacterium bavaricum TaxID=29290 RepID=A0A0F3GN16_9BACT|nr:pentapeptide repeats family protein [Candidatus Magnetobacterium bavaricum]